MNRRLLVSLMALGAIVTLVGAAGIFAVFTDQATTGTNSVTSGERASAADLQIASATATGIGDPVDCGTFVEDLVTGLFEIADAQPTGFLGTEEYVCLKNVGSSSLSLSAATLDLVDIETDCTGDEAAVGDASCGIAAPSTGAGELSSVLYIDIRQVDCTFAGSPLGGGMSGILVDLVVGEPLGVSLAPGAVDCFRLGIEYPPAPGTSDTAIQIAQTDQATWRFAFDGTTS